MTEIVRRITDQLNPKFYSVWHAKQPHKILKGGRSSTKSSVISLRLMKNFLGDPDGNVVVFRKVGNTLALSVYEQIKWAAITLGVADDFFFGTSPRVIRHKRTGTGFYFFGVDDPLKQKGAKIARGYVMALWFEELAEFDNFAEVDTVEDSYIRQKLPAGKEVEVWYSYNPPRSPYAWVNEWTDSHRGDSDYLIHKSTYLDDVKGFLSDQIRRKIEAYKKNDPDYYRWMYLGEIIGLGDLVYNINLFHKIDAVPSNERILFADIAIDTGHQVSATTYLLIGYTSKKNVVLLNTYYYSPANQTDKKAPSQMAADYADFIKKGQDKWRVNIDKETIDSAEGALRNQVKLDTGRRLHPVAKLKKVDMIDGVHDLLAQGRVFVLDTPDNQIFLEEHKRYQWDADTVESEDPKVVKENDHTCDAFQYYVLDNRRKLGFKV